MTIEKWEAREGHLQDKLRRTRAVGADNAALCEQLQQRLLVATEEAMRVL